MSEKNRSNKMKIRILIVTIFLGTCLGLCERIYAWGNKKTHPAITDKTVGASVINDYLRTQLSLSDGVSTELYWDFPSDIKERLKAGKAKPDQTTRTILEWMMAGSNIEDMTLRQARSRHHFHDPTRNAGLDNKTDHPDWWGVPTMGSPFDLTGESALVWAIQGTAPNEPTINEHSWQKARYEFYQALTSFDKSVREESLAITFLNVGHVLHLIEDLGVPPHARNDFLFAHYRSVFSHGNPLEGWVEEQIIDNGGQSPWSGTGPVVFDKLAKYFDTDAYAGDYLGDGQWPPEDLWGLAECTNYQFLSLSTVFGCSGVKYQFPHPVKEHTATPAIVEYIIDGNDIRMKIYFNGSNYCVPHLARYSYTYYKKSIWGGDVAVVDSTNTTDDVNVFEDYADITIPRTIDYATGLANYFFRGRLNAEPNWVDPNIAILTITNDSNNSGAPQTLRGGTFELYWDDVNDTRTQIEPNDITFIPEWTSASTLPNDGGLTELIAQFAPPVEAVKKYVVVYRGNICENPADPDSDDLNAIAVAVFRPGYAIITWGRDDYGQVTDAPDGNDFVAIAAGKRHCLALKSDGSLVAWGYNTYGECNVPDGTDYTAIAAGTNHSIALKSDGSIVVWGRDNLWQITDKPSGNDFVAITAGDYHSLALKTNDIIVGWGGWNDFGECDAPASDPGTVYTAIAAGSYHSLALQSDGTIKAWGNNNYGQTEIYAGAGNDHEAIAACFNYNLLLKKDDMLISWGYGDWLVPGLPRYHYRQPDGTDFVAIAAGWDHILALTADGEIFAWDWPFGDFPFDYFSRPVPPDVVFIEDIDAGYDFSVALRLP